MELSGAEIVIQALKDEGVEYVFGYPGGAVLHIYDALFREQERFKLWEAQRKQQPELLNTEGEERELRHILVRHEQGAVHAADGYARATGRPGVALVTSGPGATNAVTGIATAHLDSIPLVVITGQVPTPVIGSDAFQEVDTLGITRPCVKHNFLVKDRKDLAVTLKKAFYIATTGRPGPVVVDIPKDVTDPKVKIPYEYPQEIAMRSYNPVTKGHAGQIKKAAQMLLNAQRPMIYAGGGVVLGEASTELRTLVHWLGYPCTNTLMGLGSFPATDPLFIGMLGMHGTYEANMGMHDSDLILAIGARFDDRVTGKVDEFSPHAKVIHIDIDPASISKTIRVDVPIVGPVRAVLRELQAALQEIGQRPDPGTLAPWWGQIANWRAVDCFRYDRASPLIKPQYVLEQLYAITGGDAYVTSDVGQHQMWAAQFYKFTQPRRWINSGGLGTMGFGLPAAMGVALAHPNATVACVTGEASIQMCIQELSTCKQYNLPIKVINLNNRYMGMVRQWQEFSYESRYSSSYMDALPDFVKLVESYGHVGIRVDHPAEVEPALREAFARKDRLVFLDFQIDQSENVYPMIESGRAHNEMRLAPAWASPNQGELA